MKYKATIAKGRAGRVQPDDHIDYDFERPGFGFYWWFWLPRINWNGGSFKRKETVDIGLMWLCFWFGVIFWYTGSKECPDQAEPEKSNIDHP